MLNHSLIAALLFGVVLAQQTSKQGGGQSKQQQTFSPVSAAPLAPATLGPVAPAPVIVSPAPTVSPAPSSSAPAVVTTDLPTATPTGPSMTPSGSTLPSQAPTISPMPTSLCNAGCSGTSSSGINGFSTLDDLNCQIQYDWNQVQGGESVGVPPTYILCPNTVFNMTSSSSPSAITLLLSNSLLLCGTDGALMNECVLANVSVAIQNLDSITIRGLSFDSSPLLHKGNGSLDVQDCAFVGQGGPVVTADGTTQTSLTNCSIENMEYSTLENASNGTALLLASNGVLSLERVKIVGTVSAGATPVDLIRAENAAITIKDCDLTKNTVNNMVVGLEASTVVLSGTTIQENRFTSGLSFEGTVDVTVKECVVSGNNFSTSLLSISSQGNKAMVMTDSKFYKNTGGLSVATLRGTARFESVAFNTNVAQIGIEIFSEVALDAVGWIDNKAEWHLYVRSGGSLSFTNASVISKNLAAVAVFFLESNAICEIQDTLVTVNTVTGFHLMSVLDFSTLHVINTTISSNEIANTAIFAYSSSQVLLDQAMFSENTIEKSLFRCAINSTLEASNVTAIKNTNMGELMESDSGSSISVTDSDFSTNIVKGGMVIVRNSTATYEQVSLTNNVGGTAQVGMFQSLEGATLKLNNVYAESNTFDSFALVSGASTLDANLVFVSRHVGLTKENSTYWEVYSVSNASSLLLSDSVIDSTVSSAFVHISDSSSATIDGLQILGQTSDMDEPVYGIFTDAKSTTTLDNVCFDGGDYTTIVWSLGGKFLYSNVSATVDTMQITNDVNCNAMLVNGECIGFDRASCDPMDVALAPTTSPDAATPGQPASDGCGPGQSMWWWMWSMLAGLVPILSVIL